MEPVQTKLGAGELADTLLAEVQEFTRGATVTDDRALIGMRNL